MGIYYSLKDQKLIDSLFSKNSHSISDSLYTLKYLCIPDSTPKVEVGIGVSKRISKLAVIRNHFKRQFRAAFFLHSNDLIILSKEKNLKISVFWIQHQNTIQVKYSEIDKSVNNLIQKLVDRLSK